MRFCALVTTGLPLGNLINSDSTSFFPNLKSYIVQELGIKRNVKKVDICGFPIMAICLMLDAVYHDVANFE